MKFSERMGIVPVKSKVQVNSMDEDLRNSLWSVVYAYYFGDCNSYVSQDTKLNGLFSSVWFNFLKLPLDTLPSYSSDLIQIMRNQFFAWNYYQVYDFLDFVVSEEPRRAILIQLLNPVLKRELSGYRFIENKLVPVTDENEISSIENAIKDSDHLGLSGVKIHLTEALSKLSDRKNPDYRNSIKESISAVESICQKITNEPKGELGKTLKKLKEHLQIHAALEQGFIKLYGYTSDSDGIRHAMMEETSLDQEDALYMLISCSSFINYLIAKANKIGIQLN